MGWFGNLFGKSDSQGDPLSKLNPELREFLQKESPVKYTPAQDTAPKPQNAAPPPKPATAAPSIADQAVQPSTDGPAVPRESLYQDGRYAHLWKGYRPQAEVENEFKSDHEKLMDILEGYKERKAQIGRAALENC